MRIKHQESFATVRTEGAILPPDLLQRVADNDADLGGLSPADYHLSGERINEAVNRSWNRLLGAWTAFSAASQTLPASDAGTTLTREKWLLPLFSELGYGRLLPAKAVEIEGKTYPISHGWQHAPIHLVSFRIDLDTRTAGVAGAARSSPHSLVQELLNRTPESLWAFVSNGQRLRILRDNKSLVRQAYVEFDLQAMMDGQVYPDFKLLWLLCHQSRVESDRPELCWLEKWSQKAAREGTRAMDKLRDGVQRAIEHLGAGFIAHTANGALRDRLRQGTLDRQEYYRQMLRIVYRLIFLSVAEDRDLLFCPDSDPAARDRYTRYYSIRRLRDLAGRLRGTAHCDLWEGVTVVFSHLDEAGCPQLALPALGSFLWSDEAVESIRGCRLANHHLLEAIRSLAYTVDGHARRPVDYRNLGAEELGSIYESLLELHPRIDTDAHVFELATAAGHERKTTGSYYTPTSLVTSLLDTALDPVLDEAAKKHDPVQAILDLKVCDPAAGSGHFLIAAAHRIAKRLAAVQTGDAEPSPQAHRHALRDVIALCIYGVDINPMAVELCKVSLWMEAIEPGKPLSFIDHHIRCGNSLIGTTPALLAKGIPDDAFKPIEGDLKAVCSELKKQNRQERKDIEAGQGYLFHEPIKLGNLPGLLAQINNEPEDSLDDVRRHREQYEAAVRSSAYGHARLLADAWCAAFVWRKDKTEVGKQAVTEKVLRDIERSPHYYPPQSLVHEETRRLAEQYGFFHWHLAFPDVFRLPGKDEQPENEQAGWSGGFDVVLGNPPWEAADLLEKEFFSAKSEAIATARTTAARRKLIASLAARDPYLWAEWMETKRSHAGASHFWNHSGRFPLGSIGKLNTYRLFAELSIQTISLRGRAGLILKSGIITGVDSQPFISNLIQTGHLVSAIDFINTNLIFRDVVANERFCLLTAEGAALRPTSALYAFALDQPEQLGDESRFFVLSAEETRTLNPNDLSVPPMTSRQDKDLLVRIHRHCPPSIDERLGYNPWRLRYCQGHLNSSTGSGHFADNSYEELIERGAKLGPRNLFTLGGEVLMPYYEGKYIGQLNHRFGSFEGVCQSRRFGVKAEAADPAVTQLQDPHYEIMPRYWLSKRLAGQLFAQKETHWPWLFAFRDVCRAVVDARTVQACIMPLLPCNHKCPFLALGGSRQESALAALTLNMSWASFVLDYSLRQKLAGATLTKGVAYQLPVPSPERLRESVGSTTWWIFLSPRGLELSYSTWSLQALSVELGYGGPPFMWDERRRFLIRCELDAAYFHLYGIDRSDADHIMETFRIVKRKDVKEHGTYRTKETILQMYDQMAEAMRTGEPYQTWLDPPPGPPAEGLPEWEPGQPRPADWPVHIHPPRHVHEQGEARPGVPAVVTARRGTDDELIVEAFTDVRDGRSPDYVVACPEANARFLERARRLGVAAADVEINLALLNARKANKLKGMPTTNVYNLPGHVRPYMFAGEWSLRHLQRQLRDEIGPVALDRLLCDPSLAARFDEIAMRVKPGFAPLEYRWAALDIRKRSPRKPADRDVPFDRRLTLDNLLGEVPHEPGLYLIRSKDQPLYVNQAPDLHSQLGCHKEVAGQLLIPDWLLEGVAPAESLSLSVLAGAGADRLLGARASGIDRFKPWLNLLELEGVA